MPHRQPAPIQRSHQSCEVRLWRTDQRRPARPLGDLSLRPRPAPVDAPLVVGFFCLALAPRIHAGRSAHGRRGAAYCCELSVARSPSGLADHPLRSSVCACAVPGLPSRAAAARRPRGDPFVAVRTRDGHAHSWRPRHAGTARRPESAFERTCRHHPAASGRAAGRPCRKTPSQRPRGCHQGQRNEPPGRVLRYGSCGRVVWERCGIGSLGACAEHEAFTRPAHPQTGRCAARIRLPVEPALHRVPTVNEDHLPAPAGRADVLPRPSRAAGSNAGPELQRPAARLAATRTAPRSRHSRAQSGVNFQARTSGTC